MSISSIHTKAMRILPTKLDGVTIIEPLVHTDDRGNFAEVWERDRYAREGMPAEWRQDNIVYSRHGVLRGMHLQHPNAQHKLVTAVVGEIFDVNIDVRRGSPTFGQWVGVRLTGENRRQVSVSPGFAHGYLVLSEHSVVTYKCSTRFDPSVERAIRWDDPTIGIEWPISPTAVSAKDQAAELFSEIDMSLLPTY